MSFARLFVTGRPGFQVDTDVETPPSTGEFVPLEEEDEDGPAPPPPILPGTIRDINRQDAALDPSEGPSWSSATRETKQSYFAFLDAMGPTFRNFNINTSDINGRINTVALMFARQTGRWPSTQEMIDYPVWGQAFNTFVIGYHELPSMFYQDGLLIVNDPLLGPQLSPQDLQRETVDPTTEFLNQPTSDTFYQQFSNAITRGDNELARQLAEAQGLDFAQMVALVGSDPTLADQIKIPDGLRFDDAGELTSIGEGIFSQITISNQPGFVSAGRPRQPGETSSGIFVGTEATSQQQILEMEAFQPGVPGQSGAGFGAQVRQTLLLDSVPNWTSQQVEAALARVQTQRAPKFRSSGGGRQPLVLDRAALTRRGEDLYRDALFEEPRAIDEIVNSYEEEAKAFWNSGGSVLDFDTFVIDNLEKSGRWRALYRRKPDFQTYQEYLNQFSSTAQQFGLSGATTKQAVETAAASGASVSGFRERLTGTREFQQRNTGAFSQRFAGQLAGLGALGRS